MYICSGSVRISILPSSVTFPSQYPVQLVYLPGLTSAASKYLVFPIPWYLIIRYRVSKRCNRTSHCCKQWRIFDIAKSRYLLPAKTGHAIRTFSWQKSRPATGQQVSYLYTHHLDSNRWNYHSCPTPCSNNRLVGMYICSRARGVVIVTSSMFPFFFYQTWFKLLPRLLTIVDCICK